MAFSRSLAAGIRIPSRAVLSASNVGLAESGRTASDWRSWRRQRRANFASSTARATRDHADSVSSRLALFRLHRAVFPDGRLAWKGGSTTDESKPWGSPLTVEIQDAGSSECWAITGGEGQGGERMRRKLVDAVLGRARPRTLSDGGELAPHPPTHPFLKQSDPASHIAHVSFETRAASSSGGGGGGFVDFSSRYGAIRDTDQVTLFEQLMDSLGYKVGHVARLRFQHDDLEGSGLEQRLPGYRRDASRKAIPEARDEDERNHVRQAAVRAFNLIHELAPLLGLDRADPAEESRLSQRQAGDGNVERDALPLLHRPVISLSNGQTRRARILGALVQASHGGGEAHASDVPASSSCHGAVEGTPGSLMVLVDPFAGLDPTTRQQLSTLLGQLHAKRSPRVLVVLREQDGVPSFVTHVLHVQDDGGVLAGRKEDVARRKGHPPPPYESESRERRGDCQASNDRRGAGGYDVVKRNAQSGCGVGHTDAEPVVRLSAVDVAYNGKKVLDGVDLDIFPGTRLVLVGDNGSGKTTLLSLILGEHPQSHSLPDDRLTLFGLPRSSPRNARALLSRRVGQLSPELFGAFPRRSSSQGGLTVGDAVASGFDGIYSRRPRSDAEWRRVHGLLAHFVDLLRTTDGATATPALVGGMADDASTTPSAAADTRLEAARRLADVDFVRLGAGSQAVVLLLRAVVHSPMLLALDEPFQGMDSRQVARARAFLDAASSPPLPSSTTGSETDEDDADAFATGETHAEKRADAVRRRAMAIVLVSHYEDQWLASCGRLIRLRDGKVVERI